MDITPCNLSKHVTIILEISFGIVPAALLPASRDANPIWYNNLRRWLSANQLFERDDMGDHTSLAQSMRDLRLINLGRSRGDKPAMTDGGIDRCAFAFCARRELKPLPDACLVEYQRSALCPSKRWWFDSKLHIAIRKAHGFRNGNFPCSVSKCTAA